MNPMLIRNLLYLFSFSFIATPYLLADSFQDNQKKTSNNLISFNNVLNDRILFPTSTNITLPDFLFSRDKNNNLIDNYSFEFNKICQFEKINGKNKLY